MLGDGDMFVRSDHRVRALAPWLCAALVLTACGDDFTPPEDLAPKPSEYQPGRVGLVSLLSGGGGVEASLYERPDPLAPEVRVVEGECTLYTRPDEGACVPACGPGVCTPANQCVEVPRPASAGVITVTGLRQGLRFQPRPGGYELDTPPPVELFDPGASIRVIAAGADLPAFSAQLSGVPPLEVAFDTITLRGDRATRLIWTAAGVGRVSLEITIARPGAPLSAMLLCEADDNGSLTIPAAIAGRLRAPLEGESVRGTIARLERSVITTAAGPIEIVAGSRLVVAVEQR